MGKNYNKKIEEAEILKILTHYYPYREFSIIYSNAIELHKDFKSFPIEAVSGKTLVTIPPWLFLAVHSHPAKQQVWHL